MIPIGMTYTSKVSGLAPKFVTCENCQFEYVYFVRRSATGEDSSPLFLDNAGAQRKAQKRAEKALQKQFDKAVEAIPCPECAHYQEHMLRLVRDRKFSHSLGLARAAALGGGCWRSPPVCWAPAWKESPSPW